MTRDGHTSPAGSCPRCVAINITHEFIVVRRRVRTPVKAGVSRVGPGRAPIAILSLSLSHSFFLYLSLLLAGAWQHAAANTKNLVALADIVRLIRLDSQVTPCCDGARRRPISSVRPSAEFYPADRFSVSPCPRLLVRSYVSRSIPL